MITLEREITDEVEELLEIDPVVAWATPLDGWEPMLPEAPAEIGGLLTWTWKIAYRRLTITHVKIRYDHRTLIFSLASPCKLKRRDTLVITAFLHQLR